jgi:hypothetical protein
MHTSSKKQLQSLIAFFLFLLVYSASLAQTKEQILQLADSLAKQTLEREGLFTVLGGLKPISTVEHVQFPIDTLEKNLLNQEHAFQQLQLLQGSLNVLSDERIGFILVPFKAVHGASRSFQLLVYNQKSIQRTIETYPEFFTKRAILPTTDAQALLMMTEFEEKWDRFRAYGYLFGYPLHAVDFFVRAAMEEDATGQFVKRSFFQIPVASSETGRFVYALPENLEPLAVDLELKRKAGELLEVYKRIRDAHMVKESDYPFLELLKFIQENLSDCSCFAEKSFKLSEPIN